MRGKAYMHKAYDRVEWSFLQEMMIKIVGERSNFKKIPTHTPDHGDA